eukprot:scaffold4604_cov257-Pinguiococcus_pyrenoidosus.AAC.1
MLHEQVLHDAGGLEPERIRLSKERPNKAVLAPGVKEKRQEKNVGHEKRPSCLQPALADVKLLVDAHAVLGRRQIRERVSRSTGKKLWRRNRRLSLAKEADSCEQRYRHRGDEDPRSAVPPQCTYGRRDKRLRDMRQMRPSDPRWNIPMKKAMTGAHLYRMC